MDDGWCPFAVRLDGPESKTGYSGAQKTNAKVGVTLHIMEYESTPEWNDATTLHNALFSDRRASWTFSICKFMGTGKGNDSAILFQHYSIGTVCWAQGYQGNLWLDSIETEGIAPNKFTEPQYELLVKTLRWIKEAHRWPQQWWAVGNRDYNLQYTRPAMLFEHNAVPDAPPTNCAVFTHGQVDANRLLESLKEEEDMGLTEEQVKAIVAWDVNFLRGKIAAERDFFAWMAEFPLTQKEKDDPARETREKVKAQAFYDAQIKWRIAGGFIRA